jgi:putative membrane protein
MCHLARAHCILDTTAPPRYFDCTPCGGGFKNMKRVLFAGMALTLASVSWAQGRSQNAVTQSGSADLEFILEAAQGGMAEVELGKVAAQQGTNEEVKKFGQQMVSDHSKGEEELKALAQRCGITLPSDLDSKDKALVTRLSKLHGASFDRAYMRNMVADHKEDVAAFKREATSGKDPEVKAWAAKMLPTLEEHLKEAQAMNKTAATKSGAAN